MSRLNRRNVSHHTSTSMWRLRNSQLAKVAPLSTKGTNNAWHLWHKVATDTMTNHAEPIHLHIRNVINRLRGLSRPSNTIQTASR